MKALVTVRSLPLHLYNPRIIPKSPPLLRLRFPLLPQKVITRIMAACVHNSRPEATDRSQMDTSLCNYVKFCRHSLSDLVSRGYPLSVELDQRKSITTSAIEAGDTDDLWCQMREEARTDVEQEPILSNYYYASILAHNSLEKALASQLAIKLCDANLPSNMLSDVFLSVFNEDGEISRAIRDDLRAVKERDPACISFAHCLLNFKGFHACQAHRVAHKLWSQGRNVLALLIQNRVSEVFAVDIHPGAKIGRGILLDHATGVVIGETAVIGDNVSILHNVTLGGSGKDSGDRHPKIGNGVLIGAGTNVLGNIVVGEGAKIGAGSVVLKEVPPRTTAVGNPARLVGGSRNPIKLDKTPSFTMDQTSHINDCEWSDYVI